MAQKKNDTAQYDAFRKDLSDGNLKSLYIFHGQERYLLEYYLGQMREKLSGGGMADFNYRRFDGKDLTVPVLQEAIDALPVFSERTMVEIHDYDIFSRPEAERNAFMEILNDLPEYVCLVFVYNTIEYKPDGRLKSTSAIKKLAQVVEFCLQDQSKLTKWIKGHFKALGKSIDTRAAEHLAFITGGLMTSLSSEIEKISAYSQSTSISIEDIDAVVTPVLDAVTYKLTDAIANSDYSEAARLTSDLLLMREAPLKIVYSITLRLRQLYAAKLCSSNGYGPAKFMDMCSLRYEFQAKKLMDSAKKISVERCRSAVLLSARAAYAMNSTFTPADEILKALIIDLAAGKQVNSP